MHQRVHVPRLATNTDPLPDLELVVSEIFGPTFQGEGRSLGQHCSFLRLGGCNLCCAWCDTPYTWDWKGVNGIKFSRAKELHRRSLAAVWAEIESLGTRMLVVSGGEPLLQQKALAPLLQHAHAAGYRVEVETAGTVSPTPEIVPTVDQFNVSLKLEHSGNSASRRYRPAAVDALNSTAKSCWKFVAIKESDMEEIEALVARHHLADVFVMAEGTVPETILQRTNELAPEVLRRGWNLTTRLHVLLYGNCRGV